MAAIPNQNDIVKVIKSQTEALDAVINVVIKSASTKVVVNANKHIANLKSYQTLVDTIFGKEGIGNILLSAVKSMEQLSSTKSLKFSSLKRVIKRLNAFMKYVSKINIDSSGIEKVKEQLKPFGEFVAEIQKLFDTFLKINTPNVLTTKFLAIRLSLWRIAKLSTSLAMLNAIAPILVASMASIKLLTSVTTMLSKIFDNIATIKITIATLIKIRLIPSILRKMLRVVAAVNEIALYIAATGGLKDAMVLSAVFKMLKSVFDSIDAIKVGIMMRIKLRRISRVLLILNRIVRIIARMRIRPKALLTLMMLKIIFVNLGMALAIIILITPIVVLSIPAMIILLMGMLILKLILRIILRIVVNIARQWIIRGLLALMIIGTVLTMLALMFFVIAMVAKPVVKNAWYIVGLLGVILMVTLILGVIGFLFGVLSPYLGIMLIGLGVMLLVIFIFMMMAVMLRMIQMLQLDAEKIQENVRIVIDTTLSIITILFQKDTVESNKSKKGWIANIIGFIGDGLIMVTQAIMAVAFLAVMVVAILFVLMLASMLRLIQMLNLDVQKIQENVQIVMQTCILVIDALFTPSDISGKKSNKNWLESLLSYIGSGVVMIIKAIMAVAFLALITVAISLIMLIALMLRWLQVLDLDIPKIQENVRIVIDTALLVIDSLFGPSDIEGKKSNKNWLESLLSYIGGGLVIIIKAVMAVAFLTLITVAIALIMLIVLMLRGLQELSLNPDKIQTNINLVMDTAELVIDSIFSRDDRDGEQSNKTWLESVLNFIGSTVATIIKAVMAVVFLALTIAAIALIMVIALMLRGLQEMNLNADKIQTNVTIVMDTALYVISALYDKGDRDTGESSKGWLLSVLEWLCDPLALIIQAVMSIIFLALSIAAIALVMVLAKQLRQLQDIDLDETTVMNNVDICVSTTFHVINSIMNPNDRPDKPSKKGWLRKVLEFCGGGAILNIIDAIMAMAWLGLAVGIIYLVRMLAEHLAYIAKINLPKNITSKVNDIIRCANQVIVAVTNRKDPLDLPENKKKGGLLRRLFPRLAEIADMLSRMRWVSSVVSTVGVVQQVAETLTLINNLPDVSTIMTKVRNVCDTADAVAKMVTERTGVDIEASYSRLSFLERINIVVRSLSNLPNSSIQKTSKAIEAYQGLLKEINSVDTYRLEQAFKMFEQLAQFSKSINGNFDALADVLQHKIDITLQNINNTLIEVATTLTGVSTSLAETSDAISEGLGAAEAERENKQIVRNALAAIAGDTTNTYWKDSKAYTNLSATPELQKRIDSVMVSNGEINSGRIYKLLRNCVAGSDSIKTK